MDKAAAIRLADTLEGEGNLQAAANTWWSICSLDPYDLASREKFAEVLYDVNEPVIREGGVFATRLLLRIISFSLPTPRLSRAYFEHLAALLAARPKRTRPGLVALGLGSGRCGSTTLTHAMAGVWDVCSTHENPPMLYWVPLEVQLAFHVERFRVLSRYFAIVFDASYWWLNALARMFAEFPDTKVIGLHRETRSCVESFMTTKGTGRGSLNHWAPPANGVWAASPGDPAFPKYELPAPEITDPDAAKRAMITRYVSEYNAALAGLAAQRPNQVLLVRTEDLRNAAAYARIGAFLGCALQVPEVSLNVGTTADGIKPEMTY
jgi:hypothetical protein